jgi:signal transduction histidine kinase
VAWRLIAAVAIPTVLALAVAGIRITDATRSASAYGQVSALSVLGQQVTGLAQALEDERADTAAFIVGGRPAAGFVALHRQYAVTDGWAAAVGRLARGLGRGYPAQTRAIAATVLASLAELPGLRRQAAQSQTPALVVIDSYSAATASLFPLEDGIADLSGNSTLITSVRALGALSRMKDLASQQQAILAAALAQGHLAPEAVTALTIAEAQQASDQASFRGSATSEESWALTKTLAGPLPGQARAVEQSAIAAGDGRLTLGAHASQQWRTGMSYTVGWMRGAEQRLSSWITAYAQALRQGAQRSAIITLGAALGALALILLATMIIARSMVRPLRRLKAAALDVAEVRLPAEIHALGTAGTSGHPLQVTPIDVLTTDEIGQVARAVDRVHEEAVWLAAEETRQQRNSSAILSGFFWRSHSLLERLLPLIDSLELGEDDPERLASLFRMDHLLTRMRRSSDSALVLAGHETPRRAPEPVTLVDVLRAAVSEIEQYDRVTLNVQLSVSVRGSAVTDVVHLLAELLENATTFSPKTTEVIASGHTPRGGGSLINIIDAGPGMPEERLRELNRQLAHPPVADGAGIQHMGLLAVAHLAARHGIRVLLRRLPGGSTTAEVHLPAALISQGPTPGGWLRQAAAVPRVGSDAGANGAAADRSTSAPQVQATQEIVVGDAVPVPLGAPLPSAPPETSARHAVPEPRAGEPADAEPAAAEPTAAEPTAALPIFESVESDYLRRGREQQPTQDD